MKDIREFLENKCPYELTDDELCKFIDDALDWEICEIYGLLGELSRRTGRSFIHNNEFDYKLVYDAMEKLGYRD